MSLRKSDHPERRKIMLMRRADTEAGPAHNIGGVRKKEPRTKPSLPKMPWEADGSASAAESTACRRHVKTRNLAD